ncbi:MULTISPECIES: type II toxin-antitoxin system VapC family toxin [Planktothrix]|uniref:PilT protein domain protein n=2 Tax=Planktothrix TaxID=54304 RepID=A0A6J7ZI53_PLARU|nr:MULTISPECIES: type II toxin-antitoxin system VapC family toxin [Planktothrix]CAC5341545.1 PilT protein domain protein [Planktothrix rubescens NIVA-CYA 18]CAD5931436.1 PilT protein domain protein [Planktothrix rubescens NIVA-CYA 18]
MKYLYDTNIFIDYLAEETAVLPLFSELFLSKNEVIISSIVRIELLSFPELSNEEEAVIADLLMQFERVPLLPQIEDRTIQLRRHHRIKLPDALIAATALHCSACVMTRNLVDTLRSEDTEILRTGLV